jgi:molybdate transport system permease protein
MKFVRSFKDANPFFPAGVVATALYVAFIGLTLAALFLRAVSEGGFLESISSPLLLQALQLSAMTSVISLAIVILVGTPFAYLLARRRTRLLQIADSLVELPIILPPVVAGVAMLMAFGRHGILGPAMGAVGISIPFTTTAVIFAQIFVSAPFYIRSAKLGFQSVGRDLEDVSQTLGVSPWRTFWHTTLPLAWPLMLGGAVLAWARAMSEFGATIMFAGNFMGRTQTMPLAIMSAMERDISIALTLAVVLVVISALALVLLGFARRERSGAGI